MNSEKLVISNEIADFVQYNYANLWLKTKNDFFYGIIGDDHQRLLLKIMSVTKNNQNPAEYWVTGKSNVKGNICHFNGKITLQAIQESERTHFGVDDQFKNISKTQGLLIAKYEFFEDKNQKNTGVFSGTLKTKWFLDQKNNIKYDDLNSAADGYFNNAFVGSWKMYNSTLEKKCNWGDFRVPNANCDFDIGVGEFNVAKQYIAKGWLAIALKNKMANGAIAETKLNQKQKEWWQ